MGELSERQITIQRKRFEVGGLSKWEDFQSGRIFREAANNSKVQGGRAFKVGGLSEKQVAIQRKRFKVGGLSKWEDFQSGRTFREADNNSEEEVRGGRALLRLAAYPQSRQELL